MNQFTVAIYVILDDILKAVEHHEDAQRRINDAMVITTLMVACQYFGGNIEKARLYMSTHHCKEMLSKSQFNRRMHRNKELIESVFGFFASIFKQENARGNFLVDSFPVAVCHNIRISTCQLLDDELFRGKCVSKRTYFYGFKVAVLTTETGLPVEIAFLPGSYHDSQFLNRMHYDIPEGSAIFGDSAFQNYEVEDTASEMDRINWEICRKNNSLRGDIYQIKLWKKEMRRGIESIFSAIATLFPKSIHAVTINGFLLKTFLFVFTYGVHKWLPQL
jgi:hypothetical protein